MRSAPASAKRLRGFTLIEIVLASGLSVLAFGAVASMMLFGSKSTVAIGNYADLDMYGRKALDQMTTDIRQANKVLSCTNNQLVIQAVDISSGATNNLTYTYDSAGGTLNRIYLGNTNLLLKGIATNSLSFYMFQRNPVGGDVTTNYLTSDPTLCKILQFSWICTRSVLGMADTESVQSAKVVIRKE
jgi:hypothetical protein